MADIVQNGITQRVITAGQSLSYVGDKERLGTIPSIPLTCDIIREGKNLRDTVERPLLAACEDLYGKNIETIASSANQNDAQWSHHAYIVIHYDSLSLRNQHIAEEMIREAFAEKSVTDGHTYVRLVIPFTGNPLARDIETRAQELSNQFKDQPLTWGTLTMEEMKKWYDLAPDAEVKPDYFAPFFWDPGSKRFFYSLELLEKAKRYESTHGGQE